MGLPDITKKEQAVSALQDIASALEHIARAIDTYNNYRFGIALERRPMATESVEATVSWEDIKSDE